MRPVSAFALGLLMAFFGWPEAGRAQAPQSIRFQATVRAVDCHASTVTLDSGERVGVYRAAGAATFYVNGAGVSLCHLQQYLGAPASVWVTALNSELLVTQLEIGGPAEVSPPPAQTPAPYTGPPTPPASAPYPYTPPAPAPYPYTYPGPYPYTYYPAPAPYYPYPSVAGVVLGTIVVAGLVYLLVRGATGYLYRYPYYGRYYHYYYRPVYRPYYGPFRYAPAYRWCTTSWCR